MSLTLQSPRFYVTKLHQSVFYGGPNQVLTTPGDDASNMDSVMVSDLLTRAALRF